MEAHSWSTEILSAAKQINREFNYCVQAVEHNKTKVLLKYHSKYINKTIGLFLHKKNIKDILIRY